MKRILIFLCLIGMITSISACSDEQDPNVLKVNKSSDEMGGENYQTVVSELEESGFTNIETKKLDDLITGWLTKDGEIEQVEINGATEFSANDSFQKDSEIVITYHTFLEEEKSDTEATDEKNSDVVEKSTEEKSPETVDQSTNDASVESKQEILTEKNSKDLAALLAVQDTNDLIVVEFAKKYAGRTIEFNGYIAHMMLHGDNTTRYDILIAVGDSSQTTYSGPDFKFEDVNVFDLNLIGSEVPETIGMGQNLRITAVVEEYEENSGLFFLNPVSSEIR
ncbi:DUF4839 domain-containing protein [Microbacterium sp. APC 3898]|uniref:DUF4839 domain-containing protein n=1 Tax=Planococcus notacanthi TaxID=3035188 RepID=A0ABT7ZN20_9BACL|nr:MULTISPECIES: DUF4839 domain-containing protein [Terrabacteria group]MDN3428544.1 DUF4839 domain-containing protein [Planococcus sp. APC 4016]MDN3498748.1 DUF4839 domain-containing protein [Microbacterium sp. APC 3898]